METVRLTRVFRKEKETRYGVKPQLSIQTEQHGDDWLSTFNVRGTDAWQDGDEVQIEVTRNGDFLNFKPVVSHVGSSNPNLEARVEKLEKAVFPAKAKEEVAENDGSF